MTAIAVMYPRGPGATFDHAYYSDKHLPMVNRLFTPAGMESLTAFRGAPGPDGAEPTYEMIAILKFPSVAAFQAAAGEYGAEIFGDIPNFTNIKPLMQFNEAL